MDIESASLLLLGIVALLAACSSISLKERGQAERARIEAYAGQPVDHFTWLGRYDGWKPIGKEEALVGHRLTRRISSRSPCCEDLRFAGHIGLTSTLHTVYPAGPRLREGAWLALSDHADSPGRLWSLAGGPATRTDAARAS